MAKRRPVLGEALRAAADFVLPPQCAACGARTESHGALCGTCWSGLEFIEPPLCDRLGIPFSVDGGDGDEPLISPQAMAEPPAYDRARAAVRFNDTARTLIHGLKYRDRHDLALAMARMMARAGAEFFTDASLVLPVPLHRWRLWGRRYNQSALLAKPIAEALSLPYAVDALARIRPTRRQVGLTADQRRRNVAGAFALDPAWRGRIAGERVVLVDDVLTTGATAEGCARVLARAGAARVDVLLFARVANIVENPI
jgi:ComF family protein